MERMKMQMKSEHHLGELTVIVEVVLRIEGIQVCGGSGGYVLGVHIWNAA